MQKFFCQKDPWPTSTMFRPENDVITVETKKPKIKKRIRKSTPEGDKRRGNYWTGGKLGPKTQMVLDELKKRDMYFGEICLLFVQYADSRQSRGNVKASLDCLIKREEIYKTGESAKTIGSGSKGYLYTVKKPEVAAAV